MTINTFAKGGSDVGNGGDLVSCTPTAANSLDGMYSLDFLEFSTALGAVQPAEVKSWEESIMSIRRLFVDKLPELLPVFDDFVNNIRNEDQSRHQVWEPTDYALTEINDEDLPLAVQIPANCHNGGKLQLVQAVIRQNPDFTGSNLIVYKYMPKMFDKMANERPLQLSFLLVHEFLWSVSNNVDRNRRINWFLHSTEVKNMSRVDIISRLLGLGLDIQQIPRVLDAKGRGHFTTLQEVVANARENETIIIKEGTYSSGGAAFVRPIKLVGEGDPNKIIITGTKGYAALDVTLADNEVLSVENVTLQRFGVADVDYEPSHDMMLVSSGGLTLKNAVLKTDSRRILTLDANQVLKFDHISVTQSRKFLFLDQNFSGRLEISNSSMKSELYNLEIHNVGLWKGSFINNIFFGEWPIDLNMRDLEDTSPAEKARAQKLHDQAAQMFHGNKCPDLKKDNDFCTIQ
jgi:hypothetical protein